MAAPVADKIILPLGRGKWPRLLGIHRFAPDERREKRIEASKRYRANHPEREREIQRAYDVKMRERLAALKSGPCIDCGQTFPVECMDFDHKYSEKIKDVAMMVDFSEKKLTAEIAKCDLVCANCHRTRTKARKTWEDLTWQLL